MTEILKRAIDIYGAEHQVDVCMEEMAELTKAFIKYRRGDSKSTNELFADVQEEIADVCIMMQQMKMIFAEYGINKIIDEKVKRLKKRLEETKDE